jgi:Spy/CpxP family protein refolding chaperone
LVTKKSTKSPIPKRQGSSNSESTNNFVTIRRLVASPIIEMELTQMKTNTKRNLLTFAVVGAIAIGGYAFAQAPGGFAGGHRWHGQGFAMARLTKSLNLTPDQQTKIQPLLDQARPQIIAIHKDAMQKTQAVVDNTMTQIRPMLTPDQQKKFDALQKARQDMRNAMQELHAAMAE